jgi:hypothetical protein
VFLEEGHCGAAAIELEPELGCLTYSRVDEPDAKAAEEWDEDELDELEEDELEEEEDEDLWDEDDEEDEDY